MKKFNFTTLLTWTLLVSYTLAECPWHRDIPDLQSSCLCSYNLGHELSVQCDMVNWPKLLSALSKHATSTAVDLLYVNNSTIGVLQDNIFVNLKIHNIQLSGCRIRTVESAAFNGQEQHLKNLNLQDNELSSVPMESLKPLQNLQLLDLSHNRISTVPPGAFETLLKLSTLKLSDNNVTLENGALNGLEKSLKNLNLKGTRQAKIPAAIQGMKTLAFLDLSQNSLKELPGSDGEVAFAGLDSLTALNLERNILQDLKENAFLGVRKTLSSLSLLNNLLPDFPTAAMGTLRELRVLDIGFNLLTDLPNNAFKNNPSITLLALDGNPLTTIPFEALAHLNKTLRGLSLGGRFMHCDCRLSWVVDWIRNGDLQVTSRERNPQFCGSPPKFRDRNFYSIQPEELACNTEKKKAEVQNEPIGVATVVSANLDDLIIPQQSPHSTTTTSTTTTTTTTTTTQQPSTTRSTTPTTTTPTPSTTTTKTTTTTPTTTSTTSQTTTTKPKPKVTSVWKTTQRPSLVMSGFPARSKADDTKEVIVKNAFRQDNSVIIQWGSETANILGFRVVYRLFGDKSFKQGPPLEASEREFKIKNVPSQECIIVCVVSLEELNVSPDNVPYRQCREVRTVSSASSNMDKITIAASAAICGTIVVAVIIFIAASRRRSRKLQELHQQKLNGMKHGIPVAGLPVNCCALPASPGEPLSSLAALNAYNNSKDWDQVSAYSIHSQRPRMYNMDQPPSLDDMRSHFSGKNLRQSRQSLSMQPERASTRMPSHAGPAHSVTSSTRRSRPRSRSRDHHRPSSRYSTAGSTHTLNNYGDNSDNWTDHDMDIYMARNPTTRNGLVPL
ncbi:leucine-rich repeat and fibronectin type-III domain-containing protein hattifattener isoform X2 [Rhynchophorus ferrugineus]|uniref:Uncharacterized protein n=1 Tax=Rhynchophorus ferrugineus TaxID=354439 RepID=A0A834LZH8_RHYFE|nr:hypothetical protein GWI33_020296 [Rhynchophorus ferrugineus]